MIQAHEQALTLNHTSSVLFYLANDKQIDMQTTTSDEPFKHTNELALKYLWPIIPICFLLIGTILNILSILVFTRREMIKFSSFCYFAVLNTVNLAFLYVSVSRTIMEHNFHSDIRKLNLFSCKTHVFLTYFLSHLSSLILCAISVDRAISVMFLRQAKELCTPRVAVRVTLGLVAFNFLLSSHFLLLESGYHADNETTKLSGILCEARNGTAYFSFIENGWKIIDMTLYAFLPFLIMLACSLIILVRVAQQSKKFKNKNNNSRKTAAHLSHSSTRKDEKEKEELIGNSNNSSNTTTTTNTNNNNNNQNRNFSARTRNLALMLIPVNVLFIIFLAPVVIVMFTYEQLSQDWFTLAIVEFLSYFNFSLNFFIYLMTSSKFREEFFKLVDESLVRLRLKSSLTSNLKNGSTLRNTHKTKTTHLLIVNKTLNNTELSPVDTHLK